MKIFLFSLFIGIFAFFSCTSKPCPQITPGKSLAGIELGKTIEELRKAGYKVTETDQGTVVDGKYEIIRCKDQIIAIDMLDLSAKPACIRLNKQKISFKDSFSSVQNHLNLKECNKKPLKSGDNFYYCQQGGLLVGTTIKPTRTGFKDIAVSRIMVIKSGHKLNSLHLTCPADQK